MQPIGEGYLCAELHYVVIQELQMLGLRKKGHKEKFCAIAKQLSRPDPAGKKSSEVRIIFAISSSKFQSYASVVVNSHKLLFQVDTVSDINIISCQTWFDVDSLKLLPANLKSMIAPGMFMCFEGCSNDHLFS